MCARLSWLELPGFFRPSKRWDLVVVHKDRFVAAVEFKSQVGSFGNNLNNRTEEALGNATDLRTAARERAFGSMVPAWYLGDLSQNDQIAVSGALHHAFLTLGALTVLSSLTFWTLRPEDGETVSRGALRSA